VEGADPKENADIRVFSSRWKTAGDVTYYKDISDTSRPKQTDRFAEKENTLTLGALNLSYEFSQKVCSKVRVRNLRVGINVTDILRISTIKMERGTDYLYSRGFEMTLSTTF
ncbi:MAG: SusC/RagA family TonB-linked outer membrane protein, partial [Porphyromonadaceae bacterium]|nr:SusC/RagA family TonB-linked outer membrane protein [Porphyromonadaceae bacterium]